MAADDSPTWARLADSARRARSASLHELCRRDPKRSAAMLLEVGVGSDALALDVSLQHLAADDLRLLGPVAVETGLLGLRAALADGAVLNQTEAREVTHVRDRASAANILTAMLAFADSVRSGAVTGSSGRRFTTVVNIGIGGSDLGPRLVADAVGAGGGPEVRFVANIDPVELDRVLAGADPHSTMFVISSKTMTTTETLHNAARARAWLESAVGSRAHEHIAAVTAETDRAVAWGVPANRVFSYNRGIGGRFSLSSSAGLAAAIACGADRFLEMISGMVEMDRHFLSAEPATNIPLIHGSLAVLNALVHGCRSTAVVPYSSRLGLLVPYLQQLTMESNGKSTGLDGSAVASSAPALWGSVGTDGQHAYFQWLHQGTDPTPVDFVVVGASGDTDDEGDSSMLRRQAEILLMSHAFAQAEALAFGQSADELRAAGCEEDLIAHRVFVGNRPSSKILLRRLTPRSIGQLLAMYEHSTVVQGWLWGVNSFDQFGVERGKQLAAAIADAGPTSDDSRGSARSADVPDATESSAELSTELSTEFSTWGDARRWLES